MTANLDPHNPQTIQITGKDGKTHTGSMKSVTSDQSIWENMVEEGAKANRNGATAPPVPGVKAPKPATAKPLYRGLFSGRMTRGGTVGRIGLPTAVGFGVDAIRYLTAPNSSPKQQQSLSNIKKTVGA